MSPKLCEVWCRTGTDEQTHNATNRQTQLTYMLATFSLNLHLQSMNSLYCMLFVL